MATSVACNHVLGNVVPWAVSIRAPLCKGGPKRSIQRVNQVQNSWDPDVSASGRRDFLKLSFLAAVTISGSVPVAAPAHAGRTKIDLDAAPQGLASIDDKDLKDAYDLFQKALQVGDLADEERIWSKIIETYGNRPDEPFLKDIVARAAGNRGNARSRQGRLAEAIEDYNLAIALAPYAADPVLNRGVALEALGRFREAVEDYESVLAVQPDDPAAWNNLGNARAGLGDWTGAMAGYQRAVFLAPEFSFAQANYALAAFQVGQSGEALRIFRQLLRRYPEFPDIRAALAVALFAEGKVGDAEDNWLRVSDTRYRDRAWVKNTRRWPPRMVQALENFLDLKASS
eukprot:jgi/Mesvir1/532/Mv11393-RA.1